MAEEEDWQPDLLLEDTSYFGLLPEEVLVYLVGFLDGREVLRLQCVSSRFRRVAADERLWQRLCWRDFKMRYLSSRALWISYTRGKARTRMPHFPFDGPTTPYTIAKRPWNVRPS